MRLCLYTPFKPLDHPKPSGDLIIAQGLRDYLAGRGHTVQTVSSLRARWLYWKPWLWPVLFFARRRALKIVREFRPDFWLTYHAYYKAPDLLGPAVCRQADLPYVIFQGIYSSKRRRDWRTWPGYALNKKSLLAAERIFTNRREDLVNLARLLSPARLTYIAPGIFPADFCFEPEARLALRREWQVGETPVILAAAMFRPGVKADGLAWVIRACGALVKEGEPLRLVLVGDGKERGRLENLAAEHLPGRVRFIGQVDRNILPRYYSAADLFVFPGIRESLGMVYLEAQACGLPVVAFANGGIPEVVKNGETGILTPPFGFEEFVRSIKELLTDPERRKKMGETARQLVRQEHDLHRNYALVEEKLLELKRRSTA